MTARGKTGLALLGAAALMTFSACPTVAQGPPAGGPRRGGMRMFGMMGGGFGRAGLFLLRNQSVQQELGMTQPQIQKLGESQRQMFQQMRQNRPGRQPGQAPDPQAMEQRRQQMMTQQQSIVAQILDTKQQKRFAQIELQLAGPAAFQQTDVTTKLALTNAQKAQMRKILTAQQQAITKEMQGVDFRSMTPADRQKMADRIQAYRKVVTAKMVGVLSPAQKARWKTMLGKPFTFVMDPNAFGGGRRGGPGGGFGRPGRGPGN